MKNSYFGAALCLVSGIAVAYATVGGQYSVNVHFVPPLVTGTCSVAQFWSPPNVTCALCFCMTGTLSRCIPQPGCNPMNATTTTARPSTTTPTGSSTTTLASAASAANHKPGMQEEHVTGSPTAAPPQTNPPAPAAENGETTVPSPSMNLVRRKRRVLL